jgi:hypothetical protein
MQYCGDLVEFLKSHSKPIHQIFSPTKSFHGQLMHYSFYVVVEISLQFEKWCMQSCVIYGDFFMI